MSAVEVVYRPFSEIAADVRVAWLGTPPADVALLLNRLSGEVAMTAEAYDQWAAVRRAANGQRSGAMRALKLELETLLSHYRADNW